MFDWVAGPGERVLAVSTDDGHLYDPDVVDDPRNQERWWFLVVKTPVVLTPEQLCEHEALTEILLAAGQARKL